MRLQPYCYQLRLAESIARLASTRFNKATYNEPRKPFHAIDKETEVFHWWEEDAQL